MTPETVSLNEKIYLFKGKMFKFDIFLVNFCNLNCKWCSRWCNVVKHRQIYKTEDVVKDTLCILDKHIKLDAIGLSGGEPLLHPDIVELLRFIGECKLKYKIKYLSIQTNCKHLLKMSDEFFSLLRKYNIEVNYTRYPEESGINYNEAFKRLHDEQIRYVNTQKRFGESEDFIRNKFITEQLDFTKNIKNIERKCISCPRSCPSLWQGKIYKCANLPFIDTLNDFCNTDFKAVNDSDYIQVENVTDINQLFHMYSTTSSFEKTCQYYKFTWTPWSIGKNTKDELVIGYKQV